MDLFQLTDSFNRRLNYLRISVTDRCNLRCIYCTPPEKFKKFSHDEILTYEEIIRLVRVSVSLGITKVRITGGEPLVRKGIDDFLYELGKIKGLKDISLTTNGVFLKKHMKNIKASGIRRINISLDTLNREKYKKITGFDMFNQVWENIYAAYEADFFPIKINTVALRGINEDELTDLAELSLNYPFQIRFIEHMPIGLAEAGNPILAPEIMERISSIGKLNPVDRNILDGPAELYSYPNAVGQIGIIRPLSHHFCATCNRLRLTAQGRLRPCLLSDFEKDIRISLRNGYSDTELADIFIETARFKPSHHSLNDQYRSQVNGHMSAIGG